MGMQEALDLDFWLARGMARRMGVNVSEAMFDGVLSRAEFAEMVDRCRRCAKAGACLAYLADPRGEDPATAGNLPCQNAVAMIALRKKLLVH